MSFIVDIALVVTAGLASAGWFASTTALSGELPDTLIVAIAAVAAALVGLLLGGVPNRDRLRELGRRQLLGAMVGGALAFSIAPMTVLLIRKTDAPSGSETLFFTTAAWAVIVVAFALFARRTTTLTQLAGALLALLGAAAVVANWERPSSFSPFVKFPVLEFELLLAGVVFAGGTLMLARSVRRIGVRTTLALATLAAAAVAVIASVLHGDLSSLSVSPYLLGRLVTAAASLSALAAAWTFSVHSVGAARSASGLFVPPIVLTGAGALELIGRAYGVDPIQWPGVAAGGILIAAGAAVVYAYARPEAADAGRTAERRTDLVAFAIAGVSVVAGIVALVMPSFSASIWGHAAGRVFSAAWVMHGYEAATGWLPLALGLLALAAAHDAIRWERARMRLGIACAVIAAAATWPLLLDSPLRTWALWIPAEVLQDLGSEYARMSMKALSQPAGVVGVVLASASVVALAAGSRVSRPADHIKSEGHA